MEGSDESLPKKPRRKREPKKGDKQNPGAIVFASSRARNPNTPPVAERVLECMRIMAAGEWFGWQTRMRLAERWHVAEGTVGNDAAEASRRLRLDPDRAEELRQAKAAFFERIQREAMSRVNIKTGLPNLEVALAAAEAQLRTERIDLTPRPFAASQVAMKIIVEAAPVDESSAPADGSKPEPTPNA